MAAPRFDVGESAIFGLRAVRGVPSHKGTADILRGMMVRGSRNGLYIVQASPRCGPPHHEGNIHCA